MKLHFRLHCCIFLLFCITDPSEAPLCEMSISCDNLLCDALGRSPSAKIVISVRNHQKLDHCWHRHGSTEVAEVRKKNPCKIHEYPYHPKMYPNKIIDLSKTYTIANDTHSEGITKYISHSHFT